VPEDVRQRAGGPKPLTDTSAKSGVVTWLAKAAGSGVVSGVVAYIVKVALGRWGILDPLALALGNLLTVRGEDLAWAIAALAGLAMWAGLMWALTRRRPSVAVAQPPAAEAPTIDGQKNLMADNLHVGFPLPRIRGDGNQYVGNTMINSMQTPAALRERDLLLTEIRGVFLHEHHPDPEAMPEGYDDQWLPPDDFINAMLEKRRAPWRMRSVGKGQYQWWMAGTKPPPPPGG
jgi:hypothetical protein